MRKIQNRIHSLPLKELFFTAVFAAVCLAVGTLLFKEKLPITEIYDASAQTASCFGTGGAVVANTASHLTGSNPVIRGQYIYQIGNGPAAYARIEKRRLLDGALCNAAALCEGVSFGNGGAVTSTVTGLASHKFSAIQTDGTYLYAVGGYNSGAMSGWLIEKYRATDGAFMARDTYVAGGAPADLALGGAYMYVVGSRTGSGGSLALVIQKRNLSDLKLSTTTGFGAGGTVAYQQQFTAPGGSTAYRAHTPVGIVLQGSYLYIAGDEVASTDCFDRYAQCNLDWRVEKRNLSDGSLVNQMVLAPTGEMTDLAISQDGSFLYLAGGGIVDGLTPPPRYPLETALKSETRAGAGSYRYVGRIVRVPSSFASAVTFLDSSVSRYDSLSPKTLAADYLFTAGEIRNPNTFSGSVSPLPPYTASWYTAKLTNFVNVPFGMVQNEASTTSGSAANGIATDNAFAYVSGYTAAPDWRLERRNLSDLSLANCVVVDTTPPSVSVTDPLNGAVVGGAITVRGSASDNVGTAGVQFRLDAANIGPEDTVEPYEILWDTTAAANGPHALRAVARDAAGNSTTSLPVNITVSNATAPPTVDLTVNNSDGPVTIPYNTAGTIRWQSTDAVSCTASGGWSGAKAVPNGSESTGNLTVSQTYTITCSGSGASPDTVSDSVAVIVTGGPSGAASTTWAWASNIGWVSFSSDNCTSGCGAPPGSTYSVRLNTSTNNLSGYAWSSNVGWLSFNRSETGNPPSNDIGGGSGAIAQVNGDIVEGWARFLSACAAVPCTTSGSGPSGWDGWIRLRGQGGSPLPPGYAYYYDSSHYRKYPPPRNTSYTDAPGSPLPRCAADTTATSVETAKYFPANAGDPDACYDWYRDWLGQKGRIFNKVGMRLDPAYSVVGFNRVRIPPGSYGNVWGAYPRCTCDTSEFGYNCPSSFAAGVADPGVCEDRALMTDLPPCSLGGNCTGAEESAKIFDRRDIVPVGTLAYGVVRDPVYPQDLIGWAWGNDVTGWMSFNCKNDTPLYPSGYCSVADHRVTFSGQAPLPAFRVELIAFPNPIVKRNTAPAVATLEATVFNYDAAKAIRYDFACGNGTTHTLTKNPGVEYHIATTSCTYYSVGNYAARVTSTQIFGSAAEAVIDIEEIRVNPPERKECRPGEVCQ